MLISRHKNSYDYILIEYANMSKISLKRHYNSTTFHPEIDEPSLREVRRRKLINNFINQPLK